MCHINDFGEQTHTSAQEKGQKQNILRNSFSNC